MYEITLRELKRAVEEKQTFKVTLLANTLYGVELEKEYLTLAMKTKIPQIIALIAHRTPAKHFDADMLPIVLETKNLNAVKAIVSKSHSSFFNKDIILRAIETKNSDILKVIARHSNRLHFDRDVIESALNTKEIDVLRVTVDHIIDRNILVEYKNKIRNSMLSAHDIKNFTAQILSRSNNESYDREMQETVLDIYLDVISKHYKKGDMPENFPMKAFHDSIHQSRYYFSCPDLLNLDTLYQKDRFLILPLYTYGHAFSAVVRKIENSENFSVTVVNLGARPFESFGKGNQYKEFVYTKEDAISVIKSHSYNVRLYYPDRAVDTTHAYRNLKSKALETYSVNVTSRDQKVGNCFLKNIEKGIRYALALGLTKSENRNFNPESLRIVSKVKTEKLKIKFLKPLHRAGEKTNELTTLQLREELITSLATKFPSYNKEIIEEWGIYKARKLKTRSIPPLTPEKMKIKTKEQSPIFENKKIHRNIFITSDMPSNNMNKLAIAPTYCK